MNFYMERRKKKEYETTKTPDTEEEDIKEPSSE
jgi:hypothetical protein